MYMYNYYFILLIIIILLIIYYLYYNYLPIIYYYYFDTPLLQQKGLSFKKYLPFNNIAIFDFEKYGNHSMWMKNTFISLDILFLDKNYNILGFIKNTNPHSLKSLQIQKKSYYVIEASSGFINYYNIKINTNFKKYFTLKKI